MMDDAGQATIDDSIIEASEHDGVVVNNEAIHLLLQDASSPGNDSPLIVNTDTSLPLDDHGVGANDTDNNLVSVQSIVSNVQSSLSDLINPSVQTITTSDGSLLEPGDMILQAVTLADGSTAYIERPYARANEQLSETTLGTVSITSTEDEAAELKFIEGQAIQLEDGSRAYIHSAPKDGMQAIQLDDGTTAYISHAQVFGQMTEQLEESVAIQSVPSPAIVEKDGIILPSEIGSVSVVRNRLPSDRALALGEKAYRCNYVGCGRLYTTPHHLKVHERSHTGDRPFQCDSPNCGKAFATSYGLKSHTRVHTGEKPYKCPEMSCSKAFKTSGDLQKHIRTHTGERPFKCPFEGCERSFTTSNIRKVHIRTHTGERPYVCDMEGCNKSFASATNYKNHVRIHSGEKPYVCTVEGCNKRFTEYSSLYKHHVVHTHSKPYICNHCGKTYRQTSTLAMHRRTIHGDDSPLDAEVMLGPDGPSPKRRMTFSSVQSTNLSQGESSVVTADDGDGNLIINTSDPPVTMMSADTLVRMVSNNEPTMVAIAANSPVLQQIHAGMAGHEGSQILLVADASQLHLLQQLAQQPNANTFTINTQAVASGLQIQGHHHHNHHHQHTPAVKVQPVETSALAVITNNPTGLSSFTLSSTATLNTTAPPVDDSDCLHVSNEPPDDVKSDDLDGLRLHDDGVIL